MEIESAAAPSRTTYLVERYWPGVDEKLLLQGLTRLSGATSEMERAGRPVCHLGSLLVGDHQVVYSLIEAESESLVREANERASLPVDRISPTTLHGFTHQIAR